MCKCWVIEIFQCSRPAPSWHCLRKDKNDKSSHLCFHYFPHRLLVWNQITKRRHHIKLVHHGGEMADWSPSYLLPVQQSLTTELLFVLQALDLGTCLQKSTSRFCVSLSGWKSFRFLIILSRNIFMPLMFLWNITWH